MKNRGARVVTTLYSYILDAQVQLTLELVTRCGGYSISFKFLWMSMIPAKLIKVWSKMKVP